MSNPGKRPDGLARLIGHAAVGAAAAYFGHQVFKASEATIAAAIVGIIAHALLDEPVAQGLSDLGL